MALSNAERQKLYRQKRKEQVSELDTLRNEIALLRSELALVTNVRDSYSDANREFNSQIEKLRNENLLLVSENDNLRAEVQHLTKKLQDKPTRRSKFMDPYSETNSFFYVKNGCLHLLCWPETVSIHAPA